ncbi:HAD family hydrolase [Actinophytocola gossypii]|uniref:HAD family phosphatase n=1 Tax=Actinophytocola gossypii TaxID=2812003 RepID=A0ABT2JG07_9PSEU|nr:HAD family hydrolase [Actinophytocola gossypii]MCT2586698.1 HAD family phosphatase [Actinophytocola gossypii]
MDRPDLVASDVDGTLLDPMERITPRTERAIAKVTGSDVPFVLVSGRPPRWIPSVADAAGLTGYAVCANGATVYDIGADRVISSTDLDPVRLHDVADAVRRVLPDVRLAAERVADGLAPFVTEAGFRNPWGNPMGELDGETNDVPVAEVLGHPAVKLLIRHGKLTSRQMAEAAAEVLSGAGIEITYSTNRGLIELSAAGVTKASGLAEVCDLLSVRPERVVAFGDMPNDLPMLRWVGHGVAMANANDDVLAAADEVTAPNSDDGVAQVLERWF